MNQYIHAVPNFSEGKRLNVVETIVDEVRNKKGIKLMGYFPDADFNRTVVELIGEPKALKEALINMTGKSLELINMEEQTGSHPRIGAQDTIPIFPLKNISIEECKSLAEDIGREVFDKFKLPVYFSGVNARKPERSNLDFIRAGQYEGLKLVVHKPERAPDIGQAKLHPTGGAVIVSAGERALVAFNVILGTDRIDIARSIAGIIKGQNGGFSTVRSVGLKFTERNQVAVSMNMFDYEKTPLFRTFELVKREAARYGVSVIGSELVGTLPQEALVLVAEYFLQLENFKRDQIIENHMIELLEG